jgi:hypothetical protein
METKKTTDTWLSELDPALHRIAEILRKLIMEADPELSEAIKWGNPAYEKRGLVCYLSATKGYVTLGFFNGASLTDPEGRIEGTGKNMRHIKVRSLGDIRPEQYASWVREAVALNLRGSA